MMNVEFRKLLPMLLLAYQNKEFSAESVSSMLIRAHTESGAFLLDANLLRLDSVKYVSNDLRRFWKMTFLSREKVKRLVKTKSGKTCFRGKGYLYRVSNQGMKYVKHLTEPQAEEKRDNENFEDLVTRLVIEKHAPSEEVKKLMKDIFLPRSKKPGVTKRFSSRENDRIVNAYIKFHTARLEDAEEKRRLENKIQSLQEELRKAQNQKNDLVSEIMKFVDLLVKGATRQGDNIVIPFKSLSDAINNLKSRLAGLGVR